MGKTYKDDKFLLNVRCEAYRSPKAGTWEMQSKKDYNRPKQNKIFLREKFEYCR